MIVFSWDGNGGPRMEIGGWLRSLGLEQYGAAFRANEIGAAKRSVKLANLVHPTADGCPNLHSLGLAALVLIGSLALALEARADIRVALVIGNGAYQQAPRLPNPANDAVDVAAALKRSGFDVILATDLDKAQMDEVTIRFARSARTADVAMFYYSGHAMQFGGINYLAPVDTQLNDEADLRRMVRVDDIVSDMQQAKNLRILVLDACRDNPLAEGLKRSIGRTRAVSMQRGLAKIDTPEGMIVAYSTQAGRTAEDGNGRNSPYTTAFLKHVEAKDEIGTVFRKVSSDVYETTRQSQLPELSLSIVGEFYLNGKLTITVNGPANAPPADPCAAAESHWHSAESIGAIGAFEDHLARFPNCAFAALARARIEGLKEKAASSPPSAPRLATVEPGPPSPAPRADTGVARAIVEAARGWQSTGVVIHGPGTIDFRAVGTWVFNPSLPAVDGNGASRFSTQGRREYAFDGPSGREGQLIGRIGNGAPFIVGAQSSHRVTAGEEGPLYLVINDDINGVSGKGVTDNNGRLVVTVTTR